MPVKIKKIKIKKRFLHYIVFIQNNKVLFKKRNSNDIWEGLYDFYLLETPSAIAFEDLEDDLLLNSLKKGVIKSHSAVFKHILTHQRLETNFTVIQLSDNFSLSLSEEYEWCDENRIDSLPKPILIVNYLKKHNIQSNFAKTAE